MGPGTWATLAISESFGDFIFWGRVRQIKAPSPRFHFNWTFLCLATSFSENRAQDDNAAKPFLMK